MDSDKRGYIKEQFKKGQRLGEDPSMSPREAVRQIMTEARGEYAAAGDYTQARKQRKAAVAKRLSDLRKERGLKQQDVAQQTGINVVTLSGYEIGKSEPNLEALVRLADVYGVTLDELLCREPKA